MLYLVPDFETVSCLDLKKVGAWRYSEDITTGVITLRWTYPDKRDTGIWHPGDPFPFEKDLAEGRMFVAHNAAFEKAMWRNHMMPVYGWPDIPNKFWDCTLARCANLCIPQELDGAVRALRLPALKDTAASKIVVALSKPDRKGKMPEVTPEMVKLADDYCLEDCEAQMGLRERIGTLSKSERQVWLLDQRINERGFRVDLELVREMQVIVDDASGPLLKEFQELTNGLKIGSVKFKDWLAENGVHLPNLQKETIARLLGKEETDDEDTTCNDDNSDESTHELPPEVRRALEIKHLIGSAAIKKLDRALQIVNSDGRARGQLQYHGATPGLWAGRLLQPQNFPRGTLTALEDEGADEFVTRKVEALMTGDYKYVEQIVGPAVETVVSSLRHIIIPSPGRELVVGDFAGIQARIALAAAGQSDKTELMASGGNPYIDVACEIFGFNKADWQTKEQIKLFKKIHAFEYQIGKNTVLGLGFGMGKHKFRIRYAPHRPLEFSDGVVSFYRKEWAPKVPDLWWGLERAARDTVWEKTPHEAYGVLYQIEDNWLTARLPSGRKLHYFDPQPVRKTMPWSNPEAPDVRRAWTYRAMKTGQFKTIDAFGGLLTENLASALARDLLVSAMFKCERNGLPIVLTVHDEIICDAEKRVDNATVLRQIMEDRPQWAIDMGLPVAAETWAGERYKK